MPIEQWIAIVTIVVGILAGTAQWILNSPSRTAGTYKNLVDGMTRLSEQFNKEQKARRESDAKVNELSRKVFRLEGDLESQRAKSSAAYEVINKLQLDLGRSIARSNRLEDIVRILAAHIEKAGLGLPEDLDLSWLNGDTEG